MKHGYLTKEEIARFQELVLKNMGIDLSYEVAEDQAFRLVRLFEVITKPMGSKTIDFSSKNGNVD